MNFQEFVFLALNAVLAVQTKVLPDPKCDYIVNVKNEKAVTITNTEWPSLYKAGRTCRWIMNSPITHHCQLICDYIRLPPFTDNIRHCDKDKILVSRVGNRRLTKADTYCGRTSINTTSLSHKIVLALIPGPKSLGGRFRCTVSAVPRTSLTSFF